VIRARRCGLILVGAGFAAWLAGTGTGAADNCGSPRDCYATDTAASRAGLGLLALLLLWLLLELLGRGGQGAGGWGWPGGGAGAAGGGGAEGGEADGGLGGSASSLTDRLLGLLTGAYGFGEEGGASLALEKELYRLGGRVGDTQTLEGMVGSAHGTLGVTGEGIAEALLKGGATLDSSGLTAQAKLEATLGARFELAGTLQSGWLTQAAKGEAFAGATATGTAKAQLSSEGLDLGGEVDAFVGGKLTGEYDLTAGAVTAKATGSVSYGLGWKGGLEWKSSSTGLGVQAKGGATVGLGAEGSVGLEVNPQQLLSGIDNAVDYLASLF
jgi:hypothetical protein